MAPRRFRTVSVKEGKGFPYSLLSIGPGANPGVQAVSPQVTVSLILNTEKTEVLWCSSNWREHLLPSDPVCVGSDYVKPSSSVCDLGIYLDSDVSMRTHVARTASRCFSMLCQLRTIKRSVPADTFQGLVEVVVSLVLSRLDYGYGKLVTSR